MAKTTRARRTGSKATALQKRLHDAQKVFAQYFESGGKRVKETFDALTEIFEKKHLDQAMRAAGLGSATRRREPAAKRAPARGSAKTGRAKQPARGRIAAASSASVKRRSTKRKTRAKS